MTDQKPHPLRQRIARAIHRYDHQHALSGNDIPSKHHYGEADFVLAELRAELGEPGPVGPEPAGTVDKSAQLAPLGCGPDATVHRVTDLYERWVKAGPPPLGTSLSRWWDARLVELHAAVSGDDEPTPPIVDRPFRTHRQPAADPKEN